MNPRCPKMIERLGISYDFHFEILGRSTRIPQFAAMLIYMKTIKKIPALLLVCILSIPALGGYRSEKLPSISSLMPQTDSLCLALSTFSGECVRYEIEATEGCRGDRNGSCELHFDLAAVTNGRKIAQVEAKTRFFNSSADHCERKASAVFQKTGRVTEGLNGDQQASVDFQFETERQHLSVKSQSFGWGSNSNENLDACLAETVLILDMEDSPVFPQL